MRQSTELQLFRSRARVERLDRVGDDEGNIVLSSLGDEGRRLNKKPASKLENDVDGVRNTQRLTCVPPDPQAAAGPRISYPQQTRPCRRA